MMIYKLTALAFLIVTPLFAMIVTPLFKLNKKGFKFPDVALLLFAIEIVLVSGKFFTHNLLPYYLIIMSLLAIVISLLLVIRTQSFSYHRFMKLFWRVGFLVIVIFYLILVIFIFTLA
ncbi:integral membrane protein [Streptococcus pyogenes]|nr:integral membrane protein [Streptococcus pyogenes]